MVRPQVRTPGGGETRHGRVPGRRGWRGGRRGATGGLGGEGVQELGDDADEAAAKRLVDGPRVWGHAERIRRHHPSVISRRCLDAISRRCLDAISRRYLAPARTGGACSRRTWPGRCTPRRPGPSAAWRRPAGKVAGTVSEGSPDDVAGGSISCLEAACVATEASPGSPRLTSAHIGSPRLILASLGSFRLVSGAACVAAKATTPASKPANAQPALRSAGRADGRGLTIPVRSSKWRRRAASLTARTAGSRPMRVSSSYACESFAPVRGGGA